MTIDVDAVYEEGVLRPDRPLNLKEKARVHITIEATAEEGPAAADDDPTGWKAIDRLMGIGEAVASDVAEKHDDYLYDDPHD